MNKGLIVLGLMINWSLILGAPYTRTTGLVNIPTADILEHGVLRTGISTGFFKGWGYGLEARKLRNDIDLVIGLGLFDIGEIAFSVFSSEHLTLHIDWRVLQESKNLPAIGVGIQNISTDPTVSPYGKKYLGDHRHPLTPRTTYPHPQNNSFYIVLSKTLLPQYNLKVHLGIGSGRFQGTAEISRRFRGVFGGLEIQPIKNLRLTIEENGREAFIGIEYSLRDIYFTRSLGYLNDLVLHFGIEEIEWWFRRQNESTHVNSAGAKYGFGLRYEIGPLFENIIKPVKKATLLERIKKREEKTQKAMEELRKIREKRKAIEDRIKELREKLEEEK
jgi:hypothetical protein